MLGDGDEDKALESKAEVTLAFPSAVLVLPPAGEVEVKVMGANVGVRIVGEVAVAADLLADLFPL